MGRTHGDVAAAESNVSEGPPANDETFRVETRSFDDEASYERWFQLRSAGFSEWYQPTVPVNSRADNRHLDNTRAALFPDFYHQLVADDGTVVGFLSTVPGHWSGDPESFQPYDYIDRALQLDLRKLQALTVVRQAGEHSARLRAVFDRAAARLRASRQDNANAVFLLVVAVDPGYRGRRLPARLIDGAKDAARRLNYDYVAGPFRPNGYGRYKAERNVGHSTALFEEYCAALDDRGLPLDPWFRAVVRNGAKLVKPLDRSLTIGGSLEKFERLKRSFKPDDWYSPAPDVWECGETSTWYIDRSRQSVLSVEPNCWGYFEL